MKLPKHINLTIEHNPNSVYYEDAWAWLEANSPDWESPEIQKASADANEFWTMQWFPITPVGSIYIAAPTLDDLLAFAEKIEKEQSQ